MSKGPGGKLRFGTGALAAGGVPPQGAWDVAVLALQLLCIGVAFYRGFRVPSLWSLNYYQVSWADGFFRRGLLGMLLLPLGCERFNPYVVWVPQFAFLLLDLGLLLWLAQRGAARFAVCAFFLCAAGTLFFNEIGYTDQLLLPLSLLAMGLLERGRARSCAWLMAAAILIHEEAVVTLLPLVAVQWLRLPRARRPSCLSLALPSALVLVALLGFSTSVPFSTLRRYNMLSILCGHPLGRRDFLLYYGQALGQSFGSSYHPSELTHAVLPLIGALGLWMLGPGAFPWASWSRRLAAWVACVLPLALGLVGGTDVNRWVLLVLLQVLLLLGTEAEAPADAQARARTGGAGDGVAERGPAGGARSGTVAWWKRLLLALPLLLLLSVLNISLFDGFKPRPLTLNGVAHFDAVLHDQFSRLPVQ